MQFLGLKLASAASFALLGLGFGLPPIVCMRCRRSPTALGLLNAFSGGAFVAVGLLHMLPDADTDYALWKKAHHYSGSFPLTYLLLFLGFLSVLLLEHVVLATSPSS